MIAPNPLSQIGGDDNTLRVWDLHGLAEMPAELEWFANIDNPRICRLAFKSEDFHAK